MENKIRLLIFIIILIAEILLDSTFRKCKNINGKLLMIIHHFIGVYVWLGSVLFGNYLFHFLFILIVQILYIFHDGRCFLTKWHNKLCDYDENEKFKSWLNIIFKGYNVNMIYMILLNIILLYDLYYINKKYKFIKL